MKHCVCYFLPCLYCLHVHGIVLGGSNCYNCMLASYIATSYIGLFLLACIQSWVKCACSFVNSVTLDKVLPNPGHGSNNVMYHMDVPYRIIQLVIFVGLKISWIMWVFLSIKIIEV